MEETPDRFGARAQGYAAFRPDYPDALLDFVAALAPARCLAWDCGTGSGQAALALARRFDRVIGTDASDAQLARARPASNVTYRRAPAEASGLDPASVDLVTVAQALHWFDLDRFYPEVHRVLVPGGAFAAWTYGDPILEDPRLDQVVSRLNRVTLEPHWAPARRLVLDGYRSLPFPFLEVNAPSLTLTRAWTLAELAGYLRTWSATADYVRVRGRDPVEPVEAQLAGLWGGPQERHLVRWPLAVRAGTLPGA